jgi:hypothetical protein
MCIRDGLLLERIWLPRHIHQKQAIADGERNPKALAALAPVTRQSGPRTRKPKKGQGHDYLKGYAQTPADQARSPRRREPLNHARLW